MAPKLEMAAPTLVSMLPALSYFMALHIPPVLQSYLRYPSPLTRPPKGFLDRMLQNDFFKRPYFHPTFFPSVILRLFSILTEIPNFCSLKCNLIAFTSIPFFLYLLLSSIIQLLLNERNFDRCGGCQVRPSSCQKEPTVFFELFLLSLLRLSTNLQFSCFFLIFFYLT